MELLCDADNRGILLTRHAAEDYRVHVQRRVVPIDVALAELITATLRTWDGPVQALPADEEFEVHFIQGPVNIPRWVLGEHPPQDQ